MNRIERQLDVARHLATLLSRHAERHTAPSASDTRKMTKVTLPLGLTGRQKWSSFEALERLTKHEAIREFGQDVVDKRNESTASHRRAQLSRPVLTPSSHEGR